MGPLVDGKWRDAWYDTEKTGGKFVRQVSQFRHWITPDGAAGPSGSDGFAAETGRYHLYVSYVSLACPWAHRTLILRALKDLKEVISLNIVDHFMGPEGWTFSDTDGATPDTVNGATRLHEIYTRADPDYTGRVTVPVLWDKRRGTIVSNESSEIIRMLNSAFEGIAGNGANYYPEALRAGIDAVNADVYSNVNNGVYETGFATTQEAYEAAFHGLFECLDRLERRLASQRYLVGDRVTEADWRLFTTLVRFDSVYVGHFKCNLRRIEDYPALSGYLRDLYQHPGVAGTVDMHHIKHHYYGSHKSINPTRIVPAGPGLGLDAPHGREAL